jgi:hypothetical protein
MIAGSSAFRGCRQLSLCTMVVLAACVPASSGEPLPLAVYASSAASPWLSSAYDCAPQSAAIVLTDAAAADVSLRLGEPQDLAGPAFQVGTDDLLVVTHPQVGVGTLTPAQVEALFAGQFTDWSQVGGAELPVQVWTFAPTVDVQSFFDRIVLHQRPVSSLARLAVSAQDMSDSVGQVPGSIGLLPRRWQTGNTREALLVASMPVLALVRQAPSAMVTELLSCMQSHP